MEIVSGFVLSVNQYKDYDAIINVLTKDLVVSFEAVSLFKTNKKFINDLQVFSAGEFELYKGKTSNFKLKNCKINLSLYQETFKNKELLFPYEFIKEVIIKNPPIDDLEKFYILFDITSQFLIKDYTNSIVYLILFISFYLKLSGFSISNTIDQLTNLVINKNKKIFSNYNKDYKIISDIFEALFNKRYKDSLKFIKNYDQKYLLIVFKSVTEYFERLCEVKINSIDLI